MDPLVPWLVPSRKVGSWPWWGCCFSLDGLSSPEPLLLRTAEKTLFLQSKLQGQEQNSGSFAYDLYIICMGLEHWTLVGVDPPSHLSCGFTLPEYWFTWSKYLPESLGEFLP